MIESLAPYYEAAQQEALAAQDALPLRKLEWIVSAQPPGAIPSFAAALSRLGISVIAEHKRRSPSQGDIRPESSVDSMVSMYQVGGASAVSILTQGEHFGGSVEDISEACRAIDIPILRKDFISSEYQLYQARALGASAVLLIVAGLETPQLVSLHKEATDIGLDCLVEIHDEDELETALDIEADIIGINNRNLATHEIDLGITSHLMEEMPHDVIAVAESGYKVRNPEHMIQLRELCVDGVLIGTALMEDIDPARALRKWLDTP